MSEPIQILILSDGKPGHENQSLGLAEAMARLRPAEIRILRLDPAKGRLGKARQALGEVEQKPDFIIAAGHSTNLPLLLAAKKCGAHSICLMKPGLPMSWFGTCIVPEHDFKNPPTRKNIITCKGALNRVVAGKNERAGKLLLIGGPSKTHGYDQDSLIRQITKIASEGDWELADSRRTPETFLLALKKASPEITIHHHQNTESGWLAGRLANAQEVWVTEDSVSMIYEALTGGARVGVITMPRLRSDSRVIRGLDALAKQGYFNGDPDKKAPLLAEADRCAKIILSPF